MILLIQGANMVWLGKREPEFYGTTTAAELDAIVLKEASARNLDLQIRYTNIEGEAINWIYEAASNGTEALLMNPAGFSTAGFALRDCLKAVRGLPYVEIHITNVEARGIRPVTSGEANGVIAGFGIDSYILALDAIQRILARKAERTRI
ncbi:MAG: 3-dehydroquinate dehydratase [Alphaproteobacteria bacterium]|nr:3-dehydroquinate dehydratase [Alphaproteobacteria bacterium]